MLKISFQSGESLSIVTDNNAAAVAFKRMLKHLQHIDLSHYPFDNPYCRNLATAKSELLKHAAKLGVKVEPDQLAQQSYLNWLHKQYEVGYNGSRDWLHYHEAVHVYEQINANPDPVALYSQIDYRESAGPLNIKVQQAHLDLLVTDFSRGMCCIDWTELGKTPYEYWHNGEPDDITRMCALSKPWINLKPKLKIVLTTHNPVPPDLTNFNSWFAQYKEQWCKHWQLSDYTAREMFGRIPIGFVDDVDKLDHLLKNNDRIVSLTLNDYSNTFGNKSISHS